MGALLEIDNISCHYNGEAAVADFSLSLQQGALACLLGPNGSGKSTLLRAVAGFEPLSGGEIRLDGKLLSRPGLTVAPEHRGVGMVFQDYALFPHLTVADNIGFGLRRLPRLQRPGRVDEMLALVGLSPYRRRYPHELSGGEQQRVAVARALAPSPALLLLDEPFSNLDVALRQRLAQDLREILARQGATTLFVTHDRQEAETIADEVVMLAGRGEK